MQRAQGPVVQSCLDRPRLEVTRPPGRRPSENAVKVVREHLRLLEALASARRAAAVVAVLQALAVVGLRQLFGQDDRPVHGSPAPVDHLLLGVQCPGAVA